MSPGGVALPRDAEHATVAVAMQLHTERGRITQDLRALGIEAAPVMRALLISESEEEVLGALTWHGAQRAPLPTVHLSALLRHSSTAVRREAVTVVRATGTPGNGPGLIALLSDEDPGVRLNAIEALRRLRAPGACEGLLGAMGDPEEQVALLAGRAVADLCGGQAEGVLLEMATGGPGRHGAFAALWALRRMDSRVPLKIISDALISREVALVQEALKALALHGEVGRDLLLRHSEEPRWEARRTSLEVLARYFPKSALAVANDSLTDPSPLVRAAALDALGRLLPDEEALPLISTHISDPHQEVRAAAVIRLGLMGSAASSRALSDWWREERDGEVGRLLVEALGRGDVPLGLIALVEMLESRRDPWAFRAHHRLVCLAGRDVGSPDEWRAWVSTQEGQVRLTPGSEDE